MPPVLDPNVIDQALATAEPAAREQLEAELAAVRARAAASGASSEQLRLAEGLVLALNRPRRPEPK